MKSFPLLLSLSLCALLGCHKKNSTADGAVQNPSPAQPAEAAAPANTTEQREERTRPAPTAAEPAKPLPPPSPSVAARADNYVRENVIGDVDPSLTAELRNFVQKKGRMPQSFGEFATLRLDSIPRPPDGKKWVIDAANLQVKAVQTK